MTAIDLPRLRQWLGRRREDRDVLSLRHARLMAATLGQDPAALAEGARLPPLWHWLYFLEARPPAELGPDGHPALGGFLPPVPLAGRMWAGGRVAFPAPLPLGATVEKRSEVVAVEHKAGRSGDLVFVTVRHELFHEGTPALAEEHDIVYRDPAAARPAPSPAAAPPAERQKTLVPDSTLLFRYSALTFNGHRIHYDVDYCRAVEGYPDLVVHGPLSATLLAGFAEEVAGRELRHLAYRGLRPAFRGTALTLNAAATGDGRLALWTDLPDGSVSMRAEAVLG